MSKLLYELRMLLFSLVMRVALVTLPKTAQETLKWLSQMPIEDKPNIE